MKVPSFVSPLVLPSKRTSPSALCLSSQNDIVASAHIDDSQLLTSIQDAVRNNHLGRALKLLTNNPFIELPERTVEDLAAKLRVKGLPHQTTLINHRLQPSALSVVQFLSQSHDDSTMNKTLGSSATATSTTTASTTTKDGNEPSSTSTFPTSLNSTINGDPATRVNEIDLLVQQERLDEAFKKISNCSKDDEYGQGIRYESIESLMRLCIFKGQLRKAQYILDRIFPKFSILPTVVTFKVFIDGCGRAGSIRRALSIIDGNGFKHLDEADKSVVFTKLVDSCVQCDALNQADELVNRMKRDAIPITESVYIALLNTSSRSFSFDRSLAILAMMKRDGFSPRTLSTFNGILQAAARAGRIQDALRVYHSMLHGTNKESSSLGSSPPVPNLQTYNLLLACCERASDPDRAFKILDMMIEQGHVYPNPKSYNHIVAACARVGDIDRALQVLRRMRHEGIRINIVTYNNILEACCNAGRLERAFNLVKHIIQYERLKPNSHTYNVLIKGCAKWGMLNPALRLLSSMKSAGVLPTVVTFSVAIDACARAGGPTAIDQAFDILKQMEQMGIDPNIVTYNSLIHACAQALKVDLAFKVFDKMVGVGILPDIVTLTSLVDACGRSGQIERAFRVIDSLPKQFGSLTPNVPAYNALMHACFKGDDLKQMEVAFKQMKDRQLRPSVVTYSTLISAYASKNDMKRAIQYLTLMRRSGMRPNRIIMTSMIAAYGRLGKVELAMDMLNETKQLFGQPDEELYTSAIVASVYGGKKHLALELSNEMSQAGYFVPTVLNRMMRKIGDVERSGEELKRILNAMQSLNIRPQRAALESLVSVYSKEADLKQALEVLPDMERLGYLPNIQTYKKIVQAATLSGKFEDIVEAKRVFDMVRSRLDDQDPQLKSHNWVEFYEAILLTCSKLPDGQHKQDMMKSLSQRMVADCGTEHADLDRIKSPPPSKSSTTSEPSSSETSSPTTSTF